MSKRFEIRDSEGAVVNTIRVASQAGADAIAATLDATYVAVLIDDGSADALRLWRKTAKANRRAFFLALGMVPTQSGASHMRADFAAYVETLRATDPFNLIVTAYDDVQVFERGHPDMAGLAAALLVSEMGMSAAEAEITLDRIVAAAASIDRDPNDLARAAAILDGSEPIV